MPKSMGWDRSRKKWNLLESIAPDLKYNCRNKKMIKEVADAVEVVLHATFLTLSSLWSYESSVSFLLLVVLCLCFPYLGQVKVNFSSDSKNPGLLNQ